MSKDNSLSLERTQAFREPLPELHTSDTVEKSSSKVSIVIKDIFSKISSFFQALIGYFYSNSNQTDNIKLSKLNLTQNPLIEDDSVGEKEAIAGDKKANRDWRDHL